MFDDDHLLVDVYEMYLLCELMWDITIFLDIITIVIVSIVVGEIYLLLLMNIIMYIINVR